MSSDKITIDFNTNWWVKHDLNTVHGRLLHWFIVADPFKSFTSNEKLLEDKKFI
jgi:hypothetical protein